MSGEAVGLDDKTLLRPGEIDLVAFDAGVDLGPRKAVALDDGEEALLQVAYRHFRRPLGRLQELGAASARVVVNYSCEGGHVEAPLILRFVDGSLQRLPTQNVG